jgi:hypothetical protein
MEFFEFFFSGSGWGWRFLALLFFGSIICSICKEVFPLFTFTKNYHYTDKDEETEDGQDHPATKDDVRS